MVTTNNLYDQLPVGAIIDAVNVDPNNPNWMPLDGRVLEQADYPKLFSIIGHRPQFSVDKAASVFKVTTGQAFNSFEYLKSGTRSVVSGLNGTTFTSTDDISYTSGVNQQTFTGYYVNGSTLLTWPTLGPSIWNNGTLVSSNPNFTVAAPTNIVSPFVAFGASRYVCYNNNSSSGVSYPVSSANGVDWEANNYSSFQAFAPQTFVGVVFGASKFVILSNLVAGGFQTLTSSDGLVWTAHAIQSTGSMNFIYWDSVLSLFVASGNNPNGIFTSSDGITWSLKYNSAGSFSQILRSNGNLLAMGTTATVITSPDGAAWTARTISIAPFKTVANSSIIVCISTATTISTSIDNGVTWVANSSIAAPISASIFKDICWSPTIGKWFMSSSTATIFSSSDGLTWTAKLIPGWTLSSTMLCFSYNNEVWFAAAGINSGFGLLKTGDGITYQMKGVTNGVTISRIAVDPNNGSPIFYMACCGNPNANSTVYTIIYKSIDGINWDIISTLVTGISSSFLSLADFKFDGTNFVLNTGLTFYYSSDAINWHQAALFNNRPIVGGFCSFYIGNNMILAANSSGIIMQSTDHGQNWNFIETFLVVASSTIYTASSVSIGYCSTTSTYFFFYANTGQAIYTTDFSTFALSNNSPMNQSPVFLAPPSNSLVSLPGNFVEFDDINIANVYNGYFIMTNDGMNFYSMPAPNITEALPNGDTGSLFIDGSTFIWAISTYVYRFNFPYIKASQFQLPGFSNPAPVYGMSNRKMLKVM